MQRAQRRRLANLRAEPDWALGQMRVISRITLQSTAVRTNLGKIRAHQPPVLRLPGKGKRSARIDGFQAYCC